MAKNEESREEYLLEYCVIDNGVDFQLSRTLDSIKSSESVGVRVISAADFFSAAEDSMRTSAKYIMYVYSGTVLCDDASSIIEEEVLSSRAPWYYADETVLLAHDGHYLEKRFYHGNYSPVTFTTMNYIGGCLLISAQYLTQLKNYACSHFIAAITSYAIQLASMSDGSYIPKALIKYYQPSDLPFADIQMIKKVANECCAKHNINSLVVSRPGSCIMNPQSDTPPSIHIIHFAGDLTTEVLQEASQANADIVCFMRDDVHCSEESLHVLGRYAAMNISGLVSPQVLCGDETIYYGSFETCGIAHPVVASDEPVFVQATINSVRSTLLPYWKIFAVKKSLLSDALSDNLINSELIQKLAIELDGRGISNLYVGHVVTTADKEAQVNLKSFCSMLYRYGKKFFEDTCMNIGILPHNYTVSEDSCYVGQPIAAGRKVLVISHELSLTGAPIVLVQAVKLLKSLGWTPVVLSPLDGEVRADFENDNIPVIICRDFNNNTDWTAFLTDFDLVIANTIVPWRQIDILGTIDIPVLWWLHDARFGYEISLKYALPKTIGENIHVFSVSNYARDVLLSYRPKYGSGILPYGLDDVSSSMHDENPFVGITKKYIFVSVGTIIYRKGQDILAQAIDLLPADILSECMFYFIGKNYEQKIFSHIERAIEEHPDNIVYLESVPHDEIMRYYKYATAVICPSRDDPLPTYMAETMMVSGVCICSSNTGTASFIENGTNGYVYHNDDPHELSAVICDLIEKEDFTSIKSSARKTFEECFSTEQFKNNIVKCVNECIHSEG